MKNIVIIITGANNGIGYAITQTLLESDYQVAALDIGVDNLNEIKASFPDQLLVFKCDVSDRQQVEKAVSSVIDQWDHVDVLVNNACLALFKAFEDRSIEETRQEFEVNYFGYLHTIYAVLPYMKAQSQGIIHNLSSGVGLTGFPGICGYASTKGAIESLTRTLALEFEMHGISVNLMHPPLTNTRSASPLGVPAEVMDDPMRVGKNLARQILSKKPVITPDFRTAAYLFFAYRFPVAVGRIFAKLAEKSEGKK